MNKTQLIETIAAQTGEAKLTVARVLDAAFAEIAGAEKVRITGFGTFTRKHRLGRTSRNPRTGTPVEVPPRDVLTFKARKGVV